MILGLIPARLNSQRLPNKPLVTLEGLPIIVHVLKRAKMSKKIDKTLVCADDKKIQEVVKNFGGDSYLTDKNLKNGTERIASYLEGNKKLNNIKLVVDIQCDEVFLNPKDVDKLINFHLKNYHKFDVVIPHSLTNETRNLNYCKIISDNSGRVLYLTRSDSPTNFRTEKKPFKRHLDFISLKPDFLKKFKKLKNRDLEQYEGIELLRAIENNYRVGTFKIDQDIFSINTKDELETAKILMKSDKIKKKY
jgi:3-deoxy-manno-octulosonate cytidylyltransferase (CMP-KDO synthetase)